MTKRELINLLRIFDDDCPVFVADFRSPSEGGTRLTDLESVTANELHGIQLNAGLEELEKREARNEQ